ncbi:MAG: hypothetical protein COU11_00695 [Candidatus Harrisonbacteria bacterium CG10_big_fil_rev_8_21_14_0_10_49_15]|uniref:SHS2 domain-containing protein n=1 Tax=Candidatus Harrisonbacteria bacterium CG10_big_fil_rev_8_21_14_0_10_49_15 TaxID=1974587 RepID=A0A2H0ULX3_9BACT|nr:MAG: hypothetical protein COU11_00695 [Candidatus Harrisonbacteria bacterium CG10_big_fil_rev_8_21_14_0_10_49_15]
MSLFSHHRSDTSIGIDIGTTSVKAAVLQRTLGGSFKLVNYGLIESVGSMEHFNNAIQSSSSRALDSDLVSYLKFLSQKLKLSAHTPAFASLPSFTAYTTLLEVPVMDKRQMGAVISEKAGVYVPVPLNSVTLDWIVLGTKKIGDQVVQEILLVSIPTEKIESYVKIFEAAGLRLAGYEIETISLARALGRNEEKPVLVMDIGGRSSSFVVTKKGLALFSGQTDFSSGSLTQALATGLNISLARADMLKRRTQIIGGAGEHELSTILIPIIDVIITEADRIRKGFEAAFGESVAGVLLAGSGANMPGFADYLTKKMGLPVQTSNALQSLHYPSELEPFVAELGTTLPTAIGVALKGFF